MPADISHNFARREAANCYMLDPMHDSHRRRRLHALSWLVCVLAAWLGWSPRASLPKAIAAPEPASAAAPGPQVLKVATTLAASRGGTRMINLPGDVRPFRQVTLYAKVSGYLREIKVDKGDRVVSGQVLGVVESPETDSQEKSIAASRTDKASVASRYQALVGSGVVSQQDMDKANADLQTASADLARVQALKGYEMIRAPFDGVVTSRYVDVGALLAAATGSTGNVQPLVDVAFIRSVRIYVYIGQTEAPYVRQGDVVHITPQGRGDLKVEAHITRISRALEPRTRTMLAEIDLDNAKDLFFPGVFVDVAFNVKLPTSIVIPADAVILREGVQQVAVVENGSIHFRTVRVGDNDGHLVRVYHGLAPGDVVGLHLGDDVFDGARVEISETGH